MKKFFILFIIGLFAIQISSSSQTNKHKGNAIQRKANAIFDLQKNTQSNFEFYQTNNGIFGNNKSDSIAGGFWPRGSSNQYLFASGMWFGAMKKAMLGAYRKYVEVSYVPYNGSDWFVPGDFESVHYDINDNNDTANAYLNKDKNRVYVSTDFDRLTGVPINSDDGPNWPLWVNDTLLRSQYGAYRNTYEYNSAIRNRDHYKYGPSFVSDEDIITIFNDADLRKYDGSAFIRRQMGYPIGLEVESRIYSWSSEEDKDIAIQCYYITNKSDDTLENCYFGNIFDTDITFPENDTEGEVNDNLRYYHEDSSLNLIVGWTDTDVNEAYRGFGYIGISMLETPAVDSKGFVRKDSLFYPQSEQIGLKTYQNWTTTEDIFVDESRFNALAAGTIDQETIKSDVNTLIATGPFNMLPGDVAKVAICYSFALPAKGGEADGTYEDLTGIVKKRTSTANISTFNNNSLIGKITRAKNKYYNIASNAVKDEQVVTSTSLNSIYPNPACQLLNINLNLQYAGQVSIALYDQLGNQVQVLFSGWLNSGEQVKQFRIFNNGLSNGLYYIRLQSENVMDVKPIVIMK